MLESVEKLTKTKILVSVWIISNRKFFVFKLLQTSKCPVAWLYIHSPKIC